MREPKNQMLGTMEPPLMQLSVNLTLKLYNFKNVLLKSCDINRFQFLVYNFESLLRVSN